MTTNFPALQGGANLPASLQNVLSGMQRSEMQENVNQSFAVVSIKGKVFSIKFGGNVTPITITVNGQVFAAPYLDVVIPIANGNLSKTFYKSGYQDGSEESPDCWSEDGKFPIGPAEKRPIDPRTGLACTSCDLCPMNQFGSRISDTGRKGKACADTRKVIVLPMAPTGQKDAAGNDITVLDAENIKFGGPMMLRVPAASLKVFAEYDQKLGQLGLNYCAVVTRMAFDTTEAFPKFVLQPLRVLSEQEGQVVADTRTSPHVAQMLLGQQANTPAAAQLPGPDMSHLQGQQMPAALAQPQVIPQAPIPVQAQPQQAPVPMQLPLQQAPVQAAPAPSPIPMPPPLPPAAPAPAPVAVDPLQAAAAAGWQAHPQSPGWFYLGQEVISEADLRGRFAGPVVSAAVAAAPAPVALVQVTPGTFNAVDALLGK